MPEVGKSQNRVPNEHLTTLRSDTNSVYSITALENATATKVEGFGTHQDHVEAASLQE